MVILKYADNLSLTFTFFVIHISLGIYNYFKINTCFYHFTKKPTIFLFL